ncbi:SDR family oxidoreductase [Aestuariivirga sp. YIM B02566]|uniref:SDR family oxidoreductase n=2 Tax=Taklimakanibacter albus TaxID=2800327 RepID=A0ACC5R1I2_9HYPH|nr:SDR family oxidoreductase [Aestuariivirga sp. YIM B02566]
MRKETVLITGANRGLGLELARQYAAAGCRVLACSRGPGEPPPVAGDVTWLALDTGNEDSIATLARDLQTEAVDILINNAARRGDTGGLDTLSTEDFLATIRVNTLGPLLMVKAFRAHLERGQRRIVANISSRAGSVAEGLDADGDYAYRCSKAALNIATAKLAFDFGLIFLALHPGWVKTDMGGPEAEVPLAQSAQGLRSRIHAARPRDSGCFFSFEGTRISW